MRTLYRTAILALAFGLSAAMSGSADRFLPQQADINWHTLDAATTLAQKHNRHILVYIYADWCGYCMVEEEKVLKNKQIADLVNKRFFAVRLNAWSKEKEWFKGKEFGWMPEEKVNELAYLLLNGNLKYPSLVFLNAKGEIVTPVEGYLNAETAFKVLTFIADEHYKKTNWEAYKNAKTN